MNEVTLGKHLRMGLVARGTKHMIDYRVRTFSPPPLPRPLGRGEGLEVGSITNGR